MQALQCLGNPLFPIPAVLRLNRTLEGVKVPDALAVLFDQGDNAGDACARRDKYRCVWIKERFLGHISQAQILLLLQASVIGLLKSSQDFEQGRFARAVASNQSYTLSVFQGEISVIEQRNVPKGELGVQKS